MLIAAYKRLKKCDVSAAMTAPMFNITRTVKANTRAVNSGDKTFWPAQCEHYYMLEVSLRNIQAEKLGKTLSLILLSGQVYHMVKQLVGDNVMVKWHANARWP